MSTAARPRGLLARIAAIDDGNLMRAAFFILLLGTLSVLYVDYRELTAADALGFVAPSHPILPPFDPDSPSPRPGPEVTTDQSLLDAPLSVSLGSGGVLNLVGSIDVGAIERVRAEVDARGEYIEVVALNSPGGAVSDALEIARLIRDKGYATTVAAGHLCASSCPLLLAAGVTRTADPGAAIGVHQIYATVQAGQLPSGAQAAGLAMSDAQKTTAVITRHLSAMGVDPALWLHALETPPDRLYYLTPEEMQAYSLVTPAPA